MELSNSAYKDKYFVIGGPVAKHSGSPGGMNQSANTTNIRPFGGMEAGATLF